MVNIILDVFKQDIKMDKANIIGKTEAFIRESLKMT